MVGFLHDAAEDCEITVDEVIEQLDAVISRITDEPKENWYEEDWWEEWMEDIDVYPCTVTHSIPEEERNDIISALKLLNHRTASSREEYIKRIAGNRLALRVKLNDLENNMDISRIPDPTEKDLERNNRYKKEYEFLMTMFRDNITNKQNLI